MSEKNGAAMRAVPFGVIRALVEMAHVVGVQARITHDSPVGDFSAQAVALMSHYALYEATSRLAEMPRWCVDNLPQCDSRLRHLLELP